MRLKHLTLHGFKTFAPKTELLFGEGLTAIVGPNGSGKSNVADAVRWVLGEQSLLNLRAKRTEDLIFAGSSTRAPVSMAEVSITLDNSDRLLPLDFTEVTLTRRAYRSGENEYYLNRSRVRLRDIQEIAAVLGQAYTVVGQGLVDAALSLKPEERRELFEEAAEIRGYFVQREDALRRLSRTEENTTRIHDLLTELEPQVRRMERQARQADEYRKLKAELLGLLQRWYQARWLAALHQLSEGEKQEREAEGEVARLRAAAAAAGKALSSLREQTSTLRESLGDLNRRRVEAGQRHAAARGERAVLEERLTAASQRRESLASELAEIRKSREALEVEGESLNAESQDHTAEIEALQAEERALAASMAALSKELAESERAVEQATSQRERLERTLLSLDTRIADASRKVDDNKQAAAGAEDELAAAESRLTAVEAQLVELGAILSESRASAASADDARRDAESKLTSANEEHSRAEAVQRKLISRGDALHSQEVRMDAERQAGLYVGVRAVGAAAREGKLRGILGTVAELMRVPAELEVAVEAALGGRLQEVVVESWEHAEQAIDFLKQAGAGRSTFLPLDTLRVSPGPAAPTGDGVVGVAADLVDYDLALEKVARSVLGRLLIVESLPAARRVVSSLAASSPWTLATLEGEVVRPGGSVTGGSSTRPSDRANNRTILARERERRRLAEERTAFQSEMSAAAAKLEEAALGVSRAEANLRERSSDLQRAREREAAHRTAHDDAVAARDRLRKELQWRSELLGNARAEIEASASLVQKLEGEKARTQAALTPAGEAVAAAIKRAKEIRARRDALTVGVGESRTRLAVLAEAARNSDSRRLDLKMRLSSLAAREQEVVARLEATDAEAEKLSVRLAEAEAELVGLATLIETLEAALAPAEESVREQERAVVDAEKEVARANALLLEAETQHTRISVHREHASGALDTLWVEIVEELRSVSLDDGVRAEDDEADPIGYEQPDELPVQHVPDWRAHGEPQHALELLGLTAVSEENAAGQAAAEEGIERRVQTLRTRLARLGPVNPLASEEHDALAERHDYLQGQLADLLSAAEHLKRIIGELDRAMSERFAETFALVNEAFGQFFAALFGGGSARLELTDPKDLSQTGIEISAQPPGKRMQPLSALSGGERALTSAALLFALLKVRPVPFCVLDEVDAALDESNVVRFRDALQELGSRTQFVVVTHNRGTIEVADTLYGVSMAGDGTSKLLSLKAG